MVKNTNISSELTSNLFAITNSNYGKSAAIYECLNCGFFQCPDLSDSLRFYEDLEDEEYEQTRSERSRQERLLLNVVKRYRHYGSLLDIGAGSGILVEKALGMGYRAEGVEPSRWLQERAKKRDLPIRLGTFPHEEINKKYDIITLIDVLEHVPNPVELLSDIHDALTNKGIGVLVTPDIASFAAKIMGAKWWHFRVAHIGCFNKSTLLLALKKANLKPISIFRPVWFFPATYLFERIKKYFSLLRKIAAPKCFKSIVIPLNLHDSLMVIFKRI